MQSIDRLYFISQENTEDSHLTSIRRALDAGCKLVQLRVKNQPIENVLSQAIQARKLCNLYNARLMINDFPEIALSVKAEGVHLGPDDSSLPEARTMLGDTLIIGAEANTFDDIFQRVSQGADYISVGPFRFTTTKKNLGALIGLPGYQNIIADMRLNNIITPVVAVGGITADDVYELLEAGVYGFAFSGAITRSKNPAATVEQIQDVINNYLLTKA